VKALKNLYACGKSAHFFPPLVTAHQPTQIGSQSGSSLFHSSSIYDFHCQREAVFQGFFANELSAASMVTGWPIIFWF
jgi:hypothetical protein